MLVTIRSALRVVPINRGTGQLDQLPFTIGEAPFDEDIVQLGSPKQTEGDGQRFVQAVVVKG